MKRMSSFALYIYPRSGNSVITVQLRDHPYLRRNQPVPTVTTWVPPARQRDASDRYLAHPRTPGANLVLPGHLGQPYPTLVNRGEPGRSRITLINIRDHQGQPTCYLYVLVTLGSRSSTAVSDRPGHSRILIPGRSWKICEDPGGTVEKNLAPGVDPGKSGSRHGSCRRRAHWCFFPGRPPVLPGPSR